MFCLRKLSLAELGLSLAELHTLPNLKEKIKTFCVLIIGFP
jgi:hypothetical protein